MSSRIITVEPFDLVVFGGAGDLAYRKLLPALFERHRDGQIPPVARIIGVSRRPMHDREYRAATKAALVEHVSETDRDPGALETFLKHHHSQGISPRVVKVEELFHPATLESFKI